LLVYGWADQPGQLHVSWPHYQRSGVDSMKAGFAEYRNFCGNLRELYVRANMSTPGFVEDFTNSTAIPRRVVLRWIRESGGWLLPDKNELAQVAGFFSLKLKIEILPDTLRLDQQEFTKSLPELTREQWEAIAAERWKKPTNSPEIKKRIAAIADLLDGIIEQSTRSNLPPKQLLLTDIERNQLIAVLETTLNVLRSPIVETGILKHAGRILKQGAEKAVEKQLQIGLGKLMGNAAAKLAAFADYL
jgi:hypothetical protein